MRKNLLIALALIAFTILVTSCATTHPNQKLIVGKWKPVSVEKIFSEGEQEPGTTPSATSKAPAANDSGAKAKMIAKDGNPPAAEPVVKTGTKLDRLYWAEQRATFEVNADKTAGKDYHGRLVKMTWKMNPNGKKIIAKNVKTDEKYVLEIVELTETQAVIIEKFPIGTLKITYVRDK